MKISLKSILIVACLAVFFAVAIKIISAVFLLFSYFSLFKPKSDDVENWKKGKVNIIVYTKNKKYITITMPGCNKPRTTNSSEQFVNSVWMYGNWVIEGDVAKFSCKNNPYLGKRANAKPTDLYDSLYVSAIVNRARSEYYMDGPLKPDLISHEKKYDLFRYRLGKKTDPYTQEIIYFTAKDGNKVYLEYPIERPWRYYYKVYRRLNNDFEINYTARWRDQTFEQLVDADEKILKYINSIAVIAR